MNSSYISPPSCWKKKKKTRVMKDVHRVVTGCELYVLFVAVRALLLCRLEVKPKSRSWTSDRGRERGDLAKGGEKVIAPSFH